MLTKIDLGVYILMGLCIVAIVVSNFLTLDVSLIIPIAWALLGVIIGRKTEVVADSIVSAIKKRK